MAEAMTDEARSSIDDSTLSVWAATFDNLSQQHVRATHRSEEGYVQP